MCMVSVVIPYYTNEETVLRAMESVKLQTFRDFELILINDGSPDGSRDIITGFIGRNTDLQIKHHVQSNGGPSKARNAGIQLSEGRYVAFLDADDTWDPRKLEIQIAYMEAHPDVAISGTNYYINPGHFTKYKMKPEIIEVGFVKSLFKVLLCMPTIVVRKDVLMQDNYLFLEGKHHGEDLLFFQQIVRKYRGVRISRPLTTLYKFIYGQSGLSKDLKTLLKCDIDTLEILYKENRGSTKKIGRLLYMSLYGVYLLKHYVRIYKSWNYRNLPPVNSQQHKAQS